MASCVDQNGESPLKHAFRRITKLPESKEDEKGKFRKQNYGQLSYDSTEMHKSIVNDKNQTFCIGKQQKDFISNPLTFSISITLNNMIVSIFCKLLNSLLYIAVRNISIY